MEHQGVSNLFGGAADAMDQGVLKVEAENTLLEWEKIAEDPNTFRLSVPGGWLVCCRHWGNSPVFVADPEHKWLSLEDQEHMLATKNRLLEEQVQELKDKLALAEAELAGKKHN